MNRAVGIAPDHAQYRTVRGLLHEITGNPALASVDYREALRADPGNATAREGLARALGGAARRGPPGGRPDIPLPPSRHDPPIIRL
jgi:hypothetical protein